MSLRTVELYTHGLRSQSILVNSLGHSGDELSNVRRLYERKYRELSWLELA